MIQEFVAGQFRRPSGLVGRIWGNLMNRGNAGIIAGSVDALNVEPQHRVLEIGYGGGYGLRLMLDVLRDGTLTGLECSEVMQAKAKHSFYREIQQNRLKLVPGTVESLPLEPSSFDRVITVNTIYFWTDPLLGMREVFRVLKPGGIVVIGIRPAEWMRRLAFTRHGFTIYEPEQVHEIMDEVGFADLSFEEHEDGRLRYICVAGEKAALPTNGTKYTADRAFLNKYFL